MVQLRVISGSQAGAEVAARRFPFCIGREAGADLRLLDPGVWDQHARLHCRADEGFELEARSQACVSVNGCAAARVPLANGDLIEMGAARLRFWLAPPRQRKFHFREAVTWLGFAALVAFQGFVVWGLLR
jgi:pSer/pThr/pTyr-binding forkhead associated (FHA) protein